VTTKVRVVYQGMCGITAASRRGYVYIHILSWTRKPGAKGWRERKLGPAVTAVPV